MRGVLVTNPSVVDWILHHLENLSCKSSDPFEPRTPPEFTILSPESQASCPSGQHPAGLGQTHHIATSGHCSRWAETTRSETRSATPGPDGPAFSSPHDASENQIDSGLQCSHNDYMRHKLVGARELKARLGTYLRRVRLGQTLVVTDRGEPIAELRPLAAGTDIEAALERLKAVGAVTRTVDKPLAPFRPIENRGRSAASAVLEDREDRF